MGSNPTLLTISPYLSNRPISGGTRRIHFLNKGLAEAGWDVFQFSASGMGSAGPPPGQEIRLGERYVEYRYVNPVLAIGNRVLKELGAPQVAPSFLPGFAYGSRVLEREIAGRDAVMFESPQYWDFARRLIRPGQLVVADSHNIEFTFYDEQRSAGGMKGRAARRLYEMERELFQRADIVFTCTAEDRAKAIEAFGIDGSRIAVASNGTDARGTRPATASEREAAKQALGFAGRKVALFAGSRWGPNVEAAQAIAEIAPSVPEVQFLIVGKAGEALRGNTPANVSAPGFVEDIAPYCAAADFALNPMRSGGGSNIKLFDYFADGLPVLSTPFGARGLEVDAGSALEVCELRDFPDALRKLSDAGDLAARGERARKLALDYFDWGAISRSMSERMKELL